jgi:acetylornithine deacetylase
VHLAFSYDEELGMLGARRLVDHLSALPVRPQSCVVGEPTGMRVVVAHKGKLAMTCEVSGLAAHSALTHKGVNAIEIAAELIARLRRMGARLREQGPFDPAFDPPYTTVHTGTIEGGIALNVVPHSCRFDFEFRNLPGADAETLLAELRDYAETTLLPEMRAVHPGAAIRWLPLTDYPSLTGAENTPFFRALHGLCGCRLQGNGAKVSFGTEGGLFHGIGIATVVCGPGFIEQAHKPDEFVEHAQLDACEEFIADLVGKHCLAA